MTKNDMKLLENFSIIILAKNVSQAELYNTRIAIVITKILMQLFLLQFVIFRASVTINLSVVVIFLCLNINLDPKSLELRKNLPNI